MYERTHSTHCITSAVWNKRTYIDIDIEHTCMREHILHTALPAPHWTERIKRTYIYKRTYMYKRTHSTHCSAALDGAGGTGRSR